MAFTNWIGRSVRQGGEYNSPTVTIPAGLDEVRIQLNLLNNSDFSNTDYNIQLRVEISPDNGVTWNEYFTLAWSGGDVPQGPGGPVGWVGGVTGLAEHAGELIRAHVSSSGGFRWGIRGEIR